MNEHTCPVCGFDALELPPRDYSICGCCGTEFGYDDRVLTHKQLRLRWIRLGFPWFYDDEPKPPHWDPISQLERAGLSAALLEVLMPLDSVSDQEPEPEAPVVLVPFGTHTQYVIDEQAA